jgi:hypothetical protein
LLPTPNRALEVRKVLDAVFGRRSGATADAGREIVGGGAPMMRKLFGLALIVALSVALAAPASASRGHGGGFHGGSQHGFHHHGFHRCCFTTAFFGGVFVAAPLAYPFYAYPYYYPYPYAYPAYPPVYQEAPAIQRDVCYAGGCYHLEGDGVTVAYRWIWIPSPPEAPAAPPSQ